MDVETLWYLVRAMPTVTLALVVLLVVLPAVGVAGVARWWRGRRKK